MKSLFMLGISILLVSMTTDALAKPHHRRTYYKDHSLFKDTAPCKAKTGWTGFYAGANAGYGWGSENVDFSSAPGSALNSAIISGAIPSTTANNPHGYVAGLQAGYNYQLNRTIMGVEIDYQSTNIVDSKAVSNPVPPFATFTTKAQQQLQSIASLRARLGLAAGDDLLIYATAGPAYGNTQLSGTITNPGCVSFCGSKSTNFNSMGWMGGAGFEYNITEDWSAKAEYIYYRLQGQSQRILDPSLPGTYLSEKVQFQGNFIRVGLDYKF